MDAITKKRYLIVGLEDVGKTTILYKWKLGEVTLIIPCLYFNIEVVKTETHEVTAFDIIPGEHSITDVYKMYYKNRDAVIFVVDSSSPETIELAKHELDIILAEKGIKDAVLLVIGSKTDKTPNQSI